MPTQPTCPMPPFLELEPDTRIRHCYQLASLFVCLCLSHMLSLLLVGQCATQSTGTSEQVRPPPSTKANCPQRPTLFRLLAVALPLSSSMGGKYQMHFGHYHHTITVCMFCSFHYGSSCGSSLDERSNIICCIQNVLSRPSRCCCVVRALLACQPCQAD